MSDFKERINFILKYYNLKNIADLSKKIGYDRDEKIRRLMKGESINPSFEMLNDFINTFPELNAEWLISGEGNMLKSEQTINQTANTLNIDYKEKFEELKDKLIEAHEKIIKLSEDLAEIKTERDKLKHYIECTKHKNIETQPKPVHLKQT